MKASSGYVSHRQGLGLMLRVASLGYGGRFRAGRVKGLCPKVGVLSLQKDKNYARPTRRSAYMFALQVRPATYALSKPPNPIFARVSVGLNESGPA